MNYDPVTYPEHYVKHMPKSMPADLLDRLPHCLAQCFKYLTRCEDKGNYKQDLGKAEWYLKRFLDDEQYCAEFWVQQSDLYVFYFTLTLSGASQWFWLCKTNPFFMYLTSDVSYSGGLTECELAIQRDKLQSLLYHIQETIEKNNPQMTLKFDD